MLAAYVELVARHYEKMPDKVQGLINFEKYTLISAEVSEFKQYQPIPYNMQPSTVAHIWYVSSRANSLASRRRGGLALLALLRPGPHDTGDLLPTCRLSENPTLPQEEVVALASQLRLKRQAGKMSKPDLRRVQNSNPLAEQLPSMPELPLAELRESDTGET